MSEPGAREPEARYRAQGIEAELRRTRTILTADMLASLIAPRARIEAWWPLFQAGLFSIDGVSSGKRIRGALFGGECMLVFAVSEAAAQDLANQGLRTTVELLHEEFDTRNTRLLGKMEHEAGGRRALMETEIGGLPWKL